MACQTLFDTRSLDPETSVVLSAGSAFCACRIESKALTKASCRYAKLKPSVMFAIAMEILSGNSSDESFDNFDL